MTDGEPLRTDLPDWFAALPAAETQAGVNRLPGGHLLLLCDRGTAQLVISFGDLADAGHPEQDWPAAIDRIARAEGWSHLAILAPGPNRFQDKELCAALDDWRGQGAFAPFRRVALIGAGAGTGHAALAFAPLAPGATILAFSPQSTLDPRKAPWDDRLTGTAHPEAARPLSDARAGLATAARAYLLFDTFDRRDRRHAEALGGKGVTAIGTFGLAQDGALGLRRLGAFDRVVTDAVTGTLTAPTVHHLLRDRKNLYLYRRAMEAHLAARGRAGLAKIFAAAFKRRTRLRRAAEQRPDPEPTPTPAPPPPFHPDPRPRGTHPRTLGNVWMLEDDGWAFRYLSDQYHGRVMGYEEREGVTLAQTPPTALGIAAFGGAGAQRPLPERYDWHVVDETLNGRIPTFAATTHAVALQRHADRRHRALRTIVALTEPQAGLTLPEALPGSPRYTSLMSRIATAREALAGWGKDFFLDRIALSLLSGAPHTPLQAALDHYGDVAQAMRHDAARAAGQASFPVFVVSQGTGTRQDGGSEVILAEGLLDLAHPSLGIVVATPTYPFVLMEGAPATLDPADRMLVDEIEALAVATILDGRRWHCPLLREASFHGRTVVAAFATLGPLTLDKGVHGFALQGCKNAPAIRELRIAGNTVVLTLDTAPEGGDLWLTYAWGATAKDGDRPANRGALRETWAEPSLLSPGRTLHRHALSARVRLRPTDQPAPRAGQLA